MNKVKKLASVLLIVMLIFGVSFVQSNSYSVDVEAATSNGIKVHYRLLDTNGDMVNTVPTIYYWNSLPTNITEPTYPGVKMTKNGNWYDYSFNNVTKINMLFITNGKQSAELTRDAAGEYWYIQKANGSGKWYTSDPDYVDDITRTDLREETIYFVITTRFYDGDKGNNVHCWDDEKANNSDLDPAWRGDFKGLIDKLDYIKALGFSAIWITPVVTNASGYDYHGYHAFDFSTVDVRYESDGATYQDLINAVHDKDMKIIQDVVWNHSGNFGEATLAPMFTKDESKLASSDCMKVIKGSTLDRAYPNYESLNPDAQYQARLAVMKEDSNDVNNYYHHDKSLSYGSYTEQTGQMAGDCVDINTENPEAAQYLVDSYMQYVNMGVDSFRLDTEKHINRLTLNSAFFPSFTSVENFYIFGEVCARRRDVVNEGGLSDSCFFYTWKEPSEWANVWSSDWNTNYNNAIAHFNKYNVTNPDRTSTNAFLNGNSYHKPDYSEWNGTGTIDFTMHWNFYTATGAFNVALAEDQYFNDATWNVVYVDSHDYSPDDCQTVRYNGGTAAWAENMCLMFTFRGIPCIYYGSEIEFQAGEMIDVGPNAPLATTGRAYFGDNIEGQVSASDFGVYTASGKVQETLSAPLSQQLIKLNQIRRAIPALQKGQYSREGVSGDMAFKRAYTDSNGTSFVCVAITNGATFTGIPNGTYVDAVSGDTQVVSNGTLTVSAPGQGNCRVYVLNGTGKIGATTTYLK